jgi:uncharacterized protein YqjF (DUF2071 family)
MARAFLTARWMDLCLLSYPVPDELLLARLPPGLELDRWGGRAFVSLVAFDFLDTRVRGVRIPRHADFPEVNLRFYVRERRPDPHGGGEFRRGVVFIREYVPRRGVSLVAKLLYNEPYVTVPMTSGVECAGEAPAGRVRINHEWATRGVTNRLYVQAAGPAHRPGEDTPVHFFKEHSWGYGRSRRGRLVAYEVRHPVWDVRQVERYELTIDWGAAYGEEFAFLAGMEPASVIQAVGSEVVVNRRHE